MNATVQSIKNAVINFQNCMAQRASSGNSIYEQIANDACYAKTEEDV